MVISGGGDSALDWTVFLADVASEVTLVHRRPSFRGHPDSVQKVMDLAEQGKINLLTNAEVVGVAGDESLGSVDVKHKTDGVSKVETDHWVPLFGLSPKLGPLGEWNLNISKNAIEVDTFDYSTNIPGVYAVGDINTYPGKLMVQSAYKRIYPNKNLVLKYTTVSGAPGM